MPDQSDAQADTANIPIMSHLQASGVGNAIPLYEGALELVTPKLRAVGTGRVYLSLQGTPSVSFDVSVKTPWLAEDSRCEIQIPGLSSVTRAILTQQNLKIGRGGCNCSVAGILDGPMDLISRNDDGKPEAIGRVEFHVLNFLNFSGEGIFGKGGTSWGSRIEFSFGKWIVTLDQSANAEKYLKEAKSKRSNVITHVGILRRSDGKLFDISDGQNALMELYWFLMFAAGSRCSIVCPIGWRHLKNPIWTQWSALICSPPTDSCNWFVGSLGKSCFNAAGDFHEVYIDEEKRQWLILACGIYVAANRNEVGIEFALANSQILLEMLTWVALMEENSVMSEAAFGSLSAADKIRLLLFWLGVECKIPNSLPSLRSAGGRIAGGNSDAPQVSTEIRNSIIHPTKSNRARRRDTSNSAVFEAWQWMLWIAELTLLKVIGYTGRYSSRIDKLESKAVPWSAEGRST